MKKRKGRLLQRMMAVLLSAVLVAGMLSNAAPVTVLAQETDGQQENTGGSGTEPAAGDTKPEEKTETASGEQEKPAPEGQEEPGTTEGGGETEDGDGLTGQEPGGSMEEKPQEPDREVTQESEVMPKAALQQEARAALELYLEAEGYDEDIDGSFSDFFQVGLREAKTNTPIQFKTTVKDYSILCRAEVQPFSDFVWYLGETEYIRISSGSITSVKRPINTFYFVRFMDGANVYDTKYAVEYKRGNFQDTVTAPSAPVREGFTFAGWVTTEGGSELFDFSKKVTEATTLYALWTDDIARGTDWVLDKDGKLTISSDAGMEDWIDKGRNNHSSEVTSAELLDGVTKISNAAFNGCSGMKSITISENVASIGMWAFNDCSSLTGITIPSKVEAIGNAAFGDCSSLATVTMRRETPPTVGSDAFYGCKFVTDKSQGIHVPEGKAQTYKDAWTDWAAYIADDAPTPPVETHEHNDVTFTAWTETDSLPDAAGNYYLTEDVTLTDTWETPGGETTLCLNGKTISASGTDEYRVITIPESCTLHLYDCQNAGNITGGREGGVINFGAFHMYGGKISGNSGEVSGGGVNNQGIFRMYGGEISGNRADNYGDYGCVGGGVYIGDGTFAMYGGKISGNTASTGGGVGSVSIIGSFLTIIYDEPLTICGGAVISDNTCDGKENNVCLNDGQIITIESGNPLSGSAKIGVTTKTAPTDGNPVNITGENGADYSSFFTSDNADYEIANSDSNVVQLTVRSQSYTVTVNGGTGGGDYAAGDTVTIGANAPASGKQFDKWVVNSGSVTLASATSSTTTFTMPAEAVTVTATYKNKAGGGHSGGGSGSGGDHSGDSGNADGGNNDNGGSDNGSGSSGGNDSAGGSTGNSGGTGAGTSQTPGAPGTGQPRVKQEKEGNIRKEVRVEGESTLDAAVETPLPELADIVLTKEEKQKAAGGTDVKIVLDVKDASAVVSAADKALVEKALNGSQAKGYTLGQYLDINLFKVIGDSRSAITETNRKITVTIDVPDSLKNTDAAKIRTFAMIRVHDGEAALLADLDDNAGTITIETDRFSTYAVVYKDTTGGNSGRQSGNGKSGVVRVSAKSDGKNPGGGQDGEPKTGDSTPIELSATLAMIAGFAYLLLYFADRERGMTEETKRELVSRLVAWAKQGGRIRKYLALAAIFVLLVYYHSIGKKTCVEWKAICGE